MPVALEGVSVDDGVGIAVVLEQLLEVVRKVRETRHGHGDVLDEAGGADLTRTAHCGEDAAAHGPPLAGHGGVAREQSEKTGLTFFLRIAQLERCKGRLEFRALLGDLLGRALGHHEHGAGLVWQAREFGEILLHGAHRLAVEELGRRKRTRRLHRGDRLAGGARGGKQKERGLACGCNLPRAERRLREKHERALAAGDKTRDDLERILALGERQDREARHVLDRILPEDEVLQLRVALHAVAQRAEAFHEIGV